MQTAVTFTLAVAALFFSFACALLLEELLFGGLFRMFFARGGEPYATSPAGRVLPGGATFAPAEKRVETSGTTEKKPV
jgi:hypothetical protein